MASLAETLRTSAILSPKALTSLGWRAKAATVRTLEILSSASWVAAASVSCTSRLAARTLRPVSTAKRATGGTTASPTAASCGDMKNIIPAPAPVMTADRSPSDTCWVTVWLTSCESADSRLTSSPVLFRSKKATSRRMTAA